MHYTIPMDPELTPDDVQDVLDMGVEFETWFNEQVKSRRVTVAHLLHVMGLAYARLRLYVDLEHTSQLLYRKFKLMEERLHEGLRVRMGPDQDIVTTLPPAEAFERQAGLREMLASLTQTDEELDDEIEQFFNEEGV